MQRVFTQTFGVVAAIIEKDGKILLVQENLPGDPDDAKWNHPAGWIEVGEDPIGAAKKEVKEETGYEFMPTELVGMYSLVRHDLAKFRGSVVHPIKLVFCGKINRYSKNNLSGDTRGTAWFSPEEIYAMDAKTLRDSDIKQIVKDYLSGKRYPLEIITHTIVK